jgi:site-specific recombinase XerD
MRTNSSSSPPNAGRRYPAEPLIEDEVRRLLDAIDGRGPLAIRNRALVALLWRTGLRISEALDLYPRDLDDALEQVHVREGKGRKARRAAWAGGESDRALMRAWLAERKRLGLNGRQPVFCSVADGSKGAGVRKAGQPMATAYVRRLLPQLGEKAGIEKRVHAHGLRHSHATSLVAAGVRLHVIAGQLGHASTATTDTYLSKLDPSERVAAIRAATDEG